MSYIYCNYCNINYFKKIENIKIHLHKEDKKDNISYLNDIIPTDLINIIIEYKYELELYDYYKDFIIFINSIKKKLNIKNNRFNCYKINYYIIDIINILNYEFKNYEIIAIHSITGNILKLKKLNRKIYKINLKILKNSKKIYLIYN